MPLANDLGDNCHGDLRGRLGAYIQPERRMNLVESVGGDAAFPDTFKGCLDPAP